MSAKQVSILVGAVWCAFSTLIWAGTPAPEGAQVYIISPVDGEVVTSPVRVRFGLSGMGVAPAGTDRKHTGHHHLLIDVDKLPPLDRPLPSDAHHKHFGGGQTETEIELTPGKHTLQLLLGDGNHIPHEPAVLSKKITIEVK
ncbi:DUF4399 domain-containing protein [Candidatus Thiosymbion oneisti]|uniref:DUF4399 domain-containing protein n=1 Tax=Candidatus Thiosymbion oneisti TaxID=589554 RepID=UPI000A6C97E1|nr:DUF4399 domain-containing protein [Candidatus Thiosymbion oneisti]